MSLFRRRAAEPTNTNREPALGMYLRAGGNPHNIGAVALMAEVDRGRERRNAEARQAAARRRTRHMLADVTLPIDVTRTR